MTDSGSFVQTIYLYCLCQSATRKQLEEALTADLPFAFIPSPKNLTHLKGPALLLIEESPETIKRALEAQALFPRNLCLLLLTQTRLTHSERLSWIQQGFADVVNIHDREALSWAIAREQMKLQQRFLEDAPSNSYLANLLHITPVGIFHCDARKQVVYVNQRYLEITGLSLEDALGDGWIEALHPSDKEKILKHWHQNIGKPELSKGIYRYQQPKSGETRWVLGQSISEQDQNGQVIGYLGTLTDITRFKKAQEKLEDKNLELEKLNAELDKFVYSASHNLRAPLTTVMGLINLLELDAANEARVIQLGRLMGESVRRLDHFVQEIVNYSRNNHLALTIEPISFSDLLQRLKEEFSQLYDMANITILVDEQLEAPVYSDANRLFIILRNLISNGIRFQNPHIPQKEIKVTLKSNAKDLELVVEDNGLGILTKHQPYIFDMFYRADERRSGAGIGLYITRDTVLRLNGTIAVSSEPDKGTRVKVKLPNHSG